MAIPLHRSRFVVVEQVSMTAVAASAQEKPDLSWTELT
jgi:hypothetical protein